MVMLVVESLVNVDQRENCEFALVAQKMSVGWKKERLSRGSSLKRAEIFYLPEMDFSFSIVPHLESAVQCTRPHLLPPPGSELALEEQRTIIRMPATVRELAHWD